VVVVLILLHLLKGHYAAKQGQFTVEIRCLAVTWLVGWMRLQVYAVVKEKRSSRPSDTICASREHRESLVYSSLSNRIEIRIVTNQPGRRRHKADYFAIRYECSFCFLHVLRIHSSVSFVHGSCRWSLLFVHGIFGSVM